MKFLFPKLGQGLLVIWGIVTLMFIIFYALGNPTDYLVDEKADQATREATMARYGLDKPLIVQYGPRHDVVVLGPKWGETDPRSRRVRG